MNDTSQSLDADFLVVGLVRDCASTLKSEVSLLKAALAKAKNVYWLLIESDSTDETLATLEETARHLDNFRFISLGALGAELSLRTERLAFCRNAYLNELCTNQLYHDVQYVIVADFDGLNTRITEEAILSCWERKDWDVCTANQDGPYYDIWALRHDDWCANDCWAQHRFLSRYEADEGRLMYACVYAKMITLPFNAEWVEVDSAFGGLAIYRRKAIEQANYIGLNDEGAEICEHVLFHRQLRQRGYRIFINPKLINAEYTPQTEDLSATRRLSRLIRRSIRKGAEFLMGRHRFAALKGMVKRISR